MSKESKLRTVWRGMKGRCYNPKHCKFPIYGNRGIRVCDEWKESYPAFQTWAVANGYQQGLTLDRINVDGNYEPSNCRFITLTDNNRNKRNTVCLTLNGESKTIFEWCEITGLPHDVIYRRIKYHGWSDERALTTPYDKTHAHKRRQVKK